MRQIGVAQLNGGPGGANALPQAESPELYVQQGAAGPARWYHRAFRLALRGVFRLFFRVEIEGLENVPSTPVIVCANHLGWADPFLVLLFFPIEPRIYILGERQVKHLSPFRRWLIDTLQIMVALDRTKPLQALRTMEGVLKRGGSLLIFPEGHLGAREGDLLELQHGAAHAGLVTGVSLLPVGLTGTKELWLRKRLTMRVGKPVSLQEFQGEAGRAGGMRRRMQAMTAMLDAEMRALLPGERPHPRIKLLRKWLTELL